MSIRMLHLLLGTTHHLMCLLLLGTNAPRLHSHIIRIIIVRDTTTSKGLLSLFNEFPVIFTYQSAAEYLHFLCHIDRYEYQDEAEKEEQEIATHVRRGQWLKIGRR